MGREVRLNPQGLARKDKGLMDKILCDPGKILVSQDLTSGEPSVTTHFSRDKNYFDACFGMVGKAPYYDGSILRIDDIYIMTMSVSPLAAARTKEAFNTKWGGNTFAEQWVADAEVIKTALKTDRTFHKILALGLGYGMGAKKMVASAYEKGFILDYDQAKRFHTAYWQLFKGVRTLADNLAAQVTRHGHLINPFGYRLVPEPRKAYNYFIQSSVSGIIHLYASKIQLAAPYATVVTCIHDELIIEIDQDKLDIFRIDTKRAVDSLNEDLNWTVNIRVGFSPGRDWYSAK